MFFSKLFNQRKKSFQRLLLYTGPALLVSMAYMDPGNYGTDIQAGASLNYDLLWVVWLSSGMAMLLQYLSGKLGIATGLSLPEIIRDKLKKKKYIVPYWLAAEAAAAATEHCVFNNSSFLWYCIFCSRYPCWTGNDGRSFRKKSKYLGSAIRNEICKCYSNHHCNSARS